jgi:hypothetical protein
MNDKPGDAQRREGSLLIKPRFGLPLRSQALPPTNIFTRPLLSKNGPPSQERAQVDAVPELPGDEHHQGEEVEQLLTVKMPLLPKDGAHDLEQIMTLEMATPLNGTAGGDSLVLQTVSINAVAKKRTETTIKTLLFNIVLLIIGMLFVGAVVVIMLFATYAIFKIAAFVVLLIALSHFISVQVKRISRLRQKKFVTATQLLQAIDKKAISKGEDKEEDMDHLKLIKEDTAVYLYALKHKDLKRGHRR